MSYSLLMHNAARQNITDTHALCAQVLARKATLRQAIRANRAKLYCELTAAERAAVETARDEAIAELDAILLATAQESA